MSRLKISKVKRFIVRLVSMGKVYLSSARYIFLLFKPLRKSNLKIDCDNLFILTSCTNPYDDRSNVTHNKNHSCDQRFNELIQTIDSIRKYFPDALIVNLENSRLAERYYDLIKERVDLHIDYSSDSFIQATRKSNNKGVPWVSKLIKFTYEYSDIKAKKIHFLVGRYQLNFPISLSKHTSTRAQIYFKYFPEHDNVSTRYFYMENTLLKDMLPCFKATYLKAIFGNSVEDVIFKKLGSISYMLLERIGVIGMVNGVDWIDE